MLLRLLSSRAWTSWIWFISAVIVFFLVMVNICFHMLFLLVMLYEDLWVSWPFAWSSAVVNINQIHLAVLSRILFGVLNNISILFLSWSFRSCLSFEQTKYYGDHQEDKVDYCIMDLLHVFSQFHCLELILGQWYRHSKIRVADLLLTFRYFSVFINIHHSHWAEM